MLRRAFVTSQVRHKNSDAPNLGHPQLVQEHAVKVLEQELKPELHLSWRHRCGTDAPEAAVSERCARIAEMRRVEGVEQFGAEFQCPFFADTEAFEGGKVEVHQAW